MEGDGVEVANSKHLQYSRGEVPPRERARYPSGKGEVCKTFMRRFDSDPRLQFFQPLAMTLLITETLTVAEFVAMVAVSPRIPPSLPL